MAELPRSKLLNFLAQPRSANDVSNFFGVSSKVAAYHLSKEIRAGQVLITDAKIPPAILNESIQADKTDYLLRLRNSPVFTKRARLHNLNNPMIRFVSKKSLHTAQTPSHSKVRLLSLNSYEPSHLARSSMSENSKQNPSPEAARWKKPSRQQTKPTSYLILHRLLRELQETELTFTEINRRLQVSKWSLRRLVKKGMLDESWGAGGVGVRYRLSRKGDRFLKAIESTSNLDVSRLQRSMKLKTGYPI